MKANLKRTLAILPLLACSAVSWAVGPSALNARDLDRVTAGAQPDLKSLTQVLATLNARVIGLGLASLPSLSAEQMALITQLATGEPITFQRTGSGQLVATRQLPSGEQLVLVKQLGNTDAPATVQSSQGDSVSTRLLQPGETLKIQQATVNGTNYLYVRNSGPSSVTTLTRGF